MNADLTRAIREEIRRQLNVILVGNAKNATGKLEDIEEMFPGMPRIEKKPITHPYGFVSRSKAGTRSLVARGGDHASNRIIIGHFDEDRPDLNAEGEVMLYDSHGDQVYLKSGKVIITSDEVHLTKENPSDAMALASKVKSELDKIANAFSTFAPGTGGAAFPNPYVSTGADVGSSKVKAE